MEKKARTCLSEARKQRHWSQQELADRIGTTRHNVSRWEAGLTTPGPYFRAKLCEIFGKSAQELGLLERISAFSPATAVKTTSAEDTESSRSSEAAPPAIWTVPSGRNPQFTGRGEILAQLERQFFPAERAEAAHPHRAALTQPQAIKGLGGIGKTQIALEYAYRAREQGRYTHVLWVNAASEEAILRSLVTLAELLPAFPANGETDQRKLAEALIRWLEQCPQPWLLIFDNADEVSLLQPYLPKQGQGSVLLTTRAHAVGSLAASIEVDNMGLMEGTQLLLQRAQRSRASDEERNEATNIVIALAGFPLALDQAGAYIEETGCSFRDYLQMYQQHHQALLARRGRQATNYPASVATTWSLSFQQLAATNPAAIEILHLCAYLSPDAIPEELFIESAACWPAILQQAAGDRLAFDHLLEALLRFSFIKRQRENHTLSLHRLVQVVQRDTMKSEEQRQWAERVVRAVHARFPGDPKADVASWPQCLRYLEQAQACDRLIQQYDLSFPEAAELLDRAGTYLSEHASYALAEPLFQRAVQIWERQPGPENPAVAVTLNTLADLYLQQGRYAEAERLHQRALSIRERCLGPAHLLVAQSLNNLAVIYSKLERYAEAEPLFQRVLSLREQQVGPEHADLAYPLNGLAELYRRQRRYAEAEALFRRALSIRERQLGPDHARVAHPLNNLAEVYKEQGRYTEAELLFQRALAIWEQQMGPEHPLVAYPLTNLAEVYTGQARYMEAETLFQRALAIREHVLGPHHLDTSETLDGLAALRMAQGRPEEAVVLYKRVLAIREQVYGPQHPKTTEIRARLQAALLAAEKDAGAERSTA